jgi:hypothetical protein
MWATNTSLTKPIKMDEHIKIYTDSAIVINRMAQVLEENQIQSIVKDNVQSAIMAGFGSSGFEVALYVSKSDYEKAQAILKEMLEAQ